VSDKWDSLEMERILMINARRIAGEVWVGRAVEVVSTNSSDLETLARLIETFVRDFRRVEMVALLMWQHRAVDNAQLSLKVTKEMKSHFMKGLSGTEAPSGLTLW